MLNALRPNTRGVTSMTKRVNAGFAVFCHKVRVCSCGEGEKKPRTPNFPFVRIPSQHPPSVLLALQHHNHNCCRTRRLTHAAEYDTCLDHTLKAFSSLVARSYPARRHLRTFRDIATSFPSASSRLDLFFARRSVYAQGRNRSVSDYSM